MLAPAAGPVLARAPEPASDSVLDRMLPLAPDPTLASISDSAPEPDADSALDRMLAPAVDPRRPPEGEVASRPGPAFVPVAARTPASQRANGLVSSVSTRRNRGPDGNSA